MLPYRLRGGWGELVALGRLSGAWTGRGGALAQVLGLFTHKGAPGCGRAGFEGGVGSPDDAYATTGSNRRGRFSSGGSRLRYD